MNAAEETPGVFRLEVSGLSVRRIKNIFEDHYGGSMMWSGGSAYPSDGVRVTLLPPAGMLGATPTMTDALKPEYPPLPEPEVIFEDELGMRFLSWSANQMCAYVDADRAARSQPSALTDEQVDAVFAVCQGWASATYGWQSGANDAETEANRLKAAREHDEECKRRIAAILSAAGSRSSDAEDAARLDFIEKHARCDPKMDGNHVWWPTTFNNALKGPSLRAAIDAALRSQPMGRGE